LRRCCGGGAIACGDDYDWIYRNFVLDRDRYAQPCARGFSIAGARMISSG